MDWSYTYRQTFFEEFTVVNSISGTTQNSRTRPAELSASENLEVHVDNFDRTIGQIVSTTRHNGFYQRLPLEVPRHAPIRTQLNDLTLMRAQVEALQSEYQQAANSLLSVHQDMLRVEVHYEDLIEGPRPRPLAEHRPVRNLRSDTPDTESHEGQANGFPEFNFRDDPLSRDWLFKELEEDEDREERQEDRRLLRMTGLRALEDAGDYLHNVTQ